MVIGIEKICDQKGHGVGIGRLIPHSRFSVKGEKAEKGEVK